MSRAPARPSSRAHAERIARPRRCNGHLIVAPLWVAFETNLGTLLRTYDAVGACPAAPSSPHHRRCLDRGDTLPRRPCVHWMSDNLAWLPAQQLLGFRVIAVEIADGGTRLADLRPARQPTVLALGNEGSGVPDEALRLADEVVMIPMVGVGVSLNVAVAGSLVAYRLAGLS